MAVLRLLIGGIVAILMTGTRASYYGIDYNAKAAYFTFTSGGTTQYVFSLNVVANGDIYFHMSGPVIHSWIGVGIGDQMKDAFMLLAYPAANGKNTTISPRIASEHTEPVYDSSIEILKIYNDTYAPNANTVTDDGTGVIISHAMCRNCSRWLSGGKVHSLDTQSTTQPFIFALGPQVNFCSDSPEASIPRHGFVGHFTMNMKQATNSTGWYGRVPAPNVPDFTFPPTDDSFASSGSTPAVYTMTMSNAKPGAHAVLMCVAFVVVFPTGAVVMHFLRKALWHAAIQAVGLFAVLAGFGLALDFSREYNKSKEFTSGHQILGFIVLAGLLIQLGLGLVHHSIYLRSKTPSPFGRIHMLLGPVVMFLGIVNGGNSHLNIPYAIIVAIIALILFTTISCQFFCRSRRKYKPDNSGNGDKYPSLGPAADYSDYEMPRQDSFGERSSSGLEELETPVPAPYEAAAPYTPLTAYTPVTPRTWRKEEVTRWPVAPYEEGE